eukprot:scaffold15228_cov118-Isochrysis_galbana.AAC.10
MCRCIFAARPASCFLSWVKCARHPTPAKRRPQVAANPVTSFWGLPDKILVLLSFCHHAAAERKARPSRESNSFLRKKLKVKETHDARTKQLLAISRGEPPPPLNSHQARLSPLATLDEEAELLFSDVLHNHLTEYDLTQYTANRTQQKPTTQSDRIRQRHTEWVPEAGSIQVRHKRKRPVGSQWEP